MRNLRKAIAWILILMMLLSMAACGKKEEPAAPDPPHGNRAGY